MNSEKDMNGRTEFSVTSTDVVGAFIILVLLAVTSYYSGLCTARKEYNAERWNLVRSLFEEHQACEEAINKYRGKGWQLWEAKEDGEYWVGDLLD